MGVGGVVEEGEVVVVEVEDAFDRWVQLHCGKMAGFAGELEGDLLVVVAVDVGIAEGVDECAGLEASDLGDHHEKKCVGSDVERHAKKDVGTALIELQGEAAFGHIELEEGVARGQVHAAEVGHVP